MDLTYDVTGPKNCPFESRHGFPPPSTKSSSAFRILTYNILADLYADSDFSRTVLFAQCPEYAMEISYRKLLLLKELSGYQADIMCLQEVDEKVFEHDLKPVLGHNGHYEGKTMTNAMQKLKLIHKPLPGVSFEINLHE